MATSVFSAKHSSGAASNTAASGEYLAVNDLNIPGKNVSSNAARYLAASSGTDYWIPNIKSSATT